MAVLGWVYVSFRLFGRPDPILVPLWLHLGAKVVSKMSLRGSWEASKTDLIEKQQLNSGDFLIEFWLPVWLPGGRRPSHFFDQKESFTYMGAQF